MPISKILSKISTRQLQTLWIVTAASYIAFYLFAIPPMVASFLTDAEQLYGRALPRIGMTPDGFALFFTLLNLIVPLSAWTVAFVIFWKRREDRMALLVSAGLVMYSATLGRAAIAFTVSYLDLWWLVSLIRIAAGIAVIVILATFPDGRFVPRWAGGLILLAVLAAPFAGDSRNFINPNATTPGIAIAIAWFVIGLGFQFYRYRQHSTPQERQQTKWVLFGMSVAIIALALFAIANLFLALLPVEAILTRLLTRMAANTFLLFIPVSFVPVTVGIAIMRNRLWDIDLIINRSLVVIVATVFVAAVFIVLVLGIRALFQHIPSGVPFLVAAILAGALFNPTRQRVQRFLDRRLYRWRFDLIQLVAAEREKSKPQRGTLTGQTVDGYQVEGIIGVGGMADVYRAVKNNHVYAVKVLPEDAPPNDAEHFKRETAVTAQLKHSNIVHFIGAGDQPVPYLALDYIEGISLRTLMRQRTRFTLEEAASLLRGIAEALDYTHSRGVVHRDLKPTNILLRLARDGGNVVPVLIDFGLAIDNTQADSSATGSDAIGTIAYMAPEQIELGKDITPKTDIYAFGVIVYEMLTGQTPFVGNPAQVLFAHLHQPPPDARQFASSLPSAAVEAIQRALSKNAAERWDSACEMLAALTVLV
jgi:serine/threonine-protein kinase